MSDPNEVGPLGEEAAKLLGALSGWARDHVGDAGEGLTGLAGHAASAVHDLDEHLATGAPECTMCPVCRTLQAVRHLHPDVKTHLGTAATSLLYAATAFLATPTPTAGGALDVEGIDVDDAAGDWSEDQ